MTDETRETQAGAKHLAHDLQEAGQEAGRRVKSAFVALSSDEDVKRISPVVKGVAIGLGLAVAPAPTAGYLAYRGVSNLEKRGKERTERENTTPQSH